MANLGFGPLFSHYLSPIGPFSRPFLPREGRKLLTMGSKWAHSTCLCTLNSPKESLETHIFQPSLTDFWSQNSPFSRHFVTFQWTKWLVMGSKRAGFTCLAAPNGVEAFLKKHILDPFLTLFCSRDNPFSRHFVNLEGPKRLALGPKWAHLTCLNRSGSCLEKHIFDTFLTDFLSQTNALSGHFGILGGPKLATTSSKRAKKDLFWHSMWCRIIFQQLFIFFWTFGTHVFGLGAAAYRNPLG